MFSPIIESSSADEFFFFLLNNEYRKRYGIFFNRLSIDCFLVCKFLSKKMYKNNFILIIIEEEEEGKKTVPFSVFLFLSQVTRLLFLIFIIYNINIKQF